ncbi:MAG: hypothetical protein JWP59_80 [Massilia sp.]|nr:hypothetical protein [Massilia sp.]
MAASQPTPVLVAERCPDGALLGDELRREMALSEHAFYAALGERAEGAKWLSRSDCPASTGFIADAARGADLILTDAAPGVFFDAQRQINVGELLMRAGRPLLITPSAARPLLFQHALLAWDDSRECRRAATDALPLLRDSGRVSVVRLTSRDDEAAAAAQLNEVLAWLAAHGVAATALVLRDGDDAQQLVMVAGEHACDLVVAGAYGHSRLREWTFGGVTRTLLSQQHVCVLLAH